MLNLCDQENHEAIDEYVSRLMGLINSCEIANSRDSLVKDRILLETNKNGIRGPLLNDLQLNLNKCMSICRTYEHMQKQLRHIKNRI